MKESRKAKIFWVSVVGLWFSVVMILISLFLAPIMIYPFAAAGFFFIFAITQTDSNRWTELD